MEVRVRALTAFASRVRTGHYDCRQTVRVQTVQVALRAIGKTCELERGYNPSLCPPRQYIAPLEMQMEGFRRSNPIPVPELAVPVAVAEWFGKYGRDTTLPGKQAKVGMDIISFFFLLWVGEYTSSRTKGMRRTKQFRAKDI